VDERMNERMGINEWMNKFESGIKQSNQWMKGLYKWINEWMNKFETGIKQSNQWMKGLYKWMNE